MLVLPILDIPQYKYEWVQIRKFVFTELIYETRSKLMTVRKSYKNKSLKQCNVDIGLEIQMFVVMMTKPGHDRPNNLILTRW